MLKTINNAKWKINKHIKQLTNIYILLKGNNNITPFYFFFYFLLLLCIFIKYLTYLFMNMFVNIYTLL